MESQSKTKIKVLILYNKIFNYRIPIFELLATKYDLTVAYSIGDNLPENHSFKLIKLPIYKLKGLVLHKNNIYKLCSNFDVVIGLGNIRWLNINILPFVKKKRFKFIFWTIGVSTEKGFDVDSKWNKIRNYIYNKADAILLYSDYPKNLMINSGIPESKLFVAHNTTYVNLDLVNVNSENKNSLLFIGSLQKRKGIFDLLEAYKAVYLLNIPIPTLNIVGGGEEYDNICNWIHTYNLSNKILMHGPIYNDKIKAVFFNNALACISPKQAGLSVLESMGHGVPFVTSKTAITGGELFNITHNYNGLIIEDVGQLKEIIKYIYTKKETFLEMGENALSFYRNNRTIEHMVGEISHAIEFSLNN